MRGQGSHGSPYGVITSDDFLALRTGLRRERGGSSDRYRLRGREGYPRRLYVVGIGSLAITFYGLYAYLFKYEFAPFAAESLALGCIVALYAFGAWYRYTREIVFVEAGPEMLRVRKRVHNHARSYALEGRIEAIAMPHTLELSVPENANSVEKIVLDIDTRVQSTSETLDELAEAAGLRILSRTLVSDSEILVLTSEAVSELPHTTLPGAPEVEVVERASESPTIKEASIAVDTPPVVVQQQVKRRGHGLIGMERLKVNGPYGSRDYYTVYGTPLWGMFAQEAFRIHPAQRQLSYKLHGFMRVRVDFERIQRLSYGTYHQEDGRRSPPGVGLGAALVSTKGSRYGLLSKFVEEYDAAERYRIMAALERDGERLVDYMNQLLTSSPDSTRASGD